MFRAKPNNHMDSHRQRSGGELAKAKAVQRRMSVVVEPRRERTAAGCTLVGHRTDPTNRADYVLRALRFQRAEQTNEMADAASDFLLIHFSGLRKE